MKNGLVKATILVFFLSLLAKIVAFFKSILEASYFGASIEMDVFNVTQGFVSNILYMLASAIAVAFVPLYIQHNTDKQDRKRFASVTLTVLCLFAVAITALLALIAPFLVRVIAPSFKEEEYSIATVFFRILIIGIVFSLAASISSGILNSEKKYGLPALSSLINSVVLILFMVLFSKSLGVWTLVFALPASYLIQWLVLYLIGRKYARITFKYGLKDEGIKLLIIQAAPILISQATVEINQVVDRALLSGVEAGALTAVSYSAVLYQFVTTIVSTPIATVLFTELSEAGAEKNFGRMKNILSDSSRILVLLCIPIVAVSFFCSADIVTIIYGHGRFSGNAIFQCADGLKMYIFCLLPVSIKTVLSRAYYGLNDTKRPMIFGILEVALNIGLSFILVRFWGILGVVGATAIASYVFIVVMMIDFNKRYVLFSSWKTRISYWKILLAGVVGVLTLLVLNCFFRFTPLVSFVVKTLAVFAVYGLVLVSLREQSLMKLVDILKRKISKR